MTTGAEWGGAVGDVWSREWRRTDQSFADLDPALDAAILAVAPDAGRALDIGCGAGRTSLALADARFDLAITGIDLSPSLVEVARQRGEGRSNLGFRIGDASRPPSGGRYDLLYSRHGVMFFDDPTAAFARLRAAAVSGSALVFSCFRSPRENVWASTLTAVAGIAPPLVDGYAPGPFAFADPDFVASLLAESGWHDAKPTSVDYTYVAGIGLNSIADAVSFFQQIGPSAPAFRGLVGPERNAVATRLAAALEPFRTANTVAMPAAAWIWSARA